MLNLMKWESGVFKWQLNGSQETLTLTLTLSEWVLHTGTEVPVWPGILFSRLFLPFPNSYTQWKAHGSQLSLNVLWDTGMQPLHPSSVGRVSISVVELRWNSWLAFRGHVERWVCVTSLSTQVSHQGWQGISTQGKHVGGGSPSLSQPQSVCSFRGRAPLSLRSSGSLLSSHWGCIQDSPMRPHRTRLSSWCGVLDTVLLVLLWHSWVGGSPGRRRYLKQAGRCLNMSSLHRVQVKHQEKVGQARKLSQVVSSLLTSEP